MNLAFTMVKPFRLIATWLLLHTVLESGDVQSFQYPNSHGRASTTSLNGLPVPFFAQQQSSAISEQQKEGRASITTRLPIGKVFDSSRDYIFNTASNVRGYEWTLKETEELLDDLLDGAKGAFSTTTTATAEERQDYELSQIVLIPMQWDRDLLGLGGRYDVYDGQQRLVTLCLMFAAMRERFQVMEEEKETATELADILKPPKTRKEEILRMELNPRDNQALSYILKGDMDQVDKLISNNSLAKMSKANQQIVKNFDFISSRIGELEKEELLTLLDFMIENVYLLVCVPENAAIARNIVMGQGKGKDHEVIDDFKGLVCFRYITTKDEKAIYQTFDAWDTLSSSVVDIDMGVVGRDTVADACIMRATTALRTKIGTRKQLFWLEQWLREDIVSKKHQGNDFFKTQVQPASLALGHFREDGIALEFGFSKGGMITKLWPSIESRLDFLREMIQGVSATKEIEMIVLESILRAGGGSATRKKRLSLAELEQCLHGAEQLVLYFALIRPTATKKYIKCFALLDAIESGKTSSLNLLSDKEQLEMKDALSFNNLGANAGGKRLAKALLKRLNRATMQKDGQDISVAGPAFLEPILPAKATNKAWGNVWPEKADREEWVHRFGNQCLVSKQVATRDAKLAFPEKKERYKTEPWPLTSRLDEVESWDKTRLQENAATMIGLIASVWGLQLS